MELILGGARSGKSALAEQRATASGLPMTYIATATAGDAEMASRIAHHRSRRPDEWRLIEEPVALATALERAAAPDRCLLVDCLTLWLSNLLFDPDHGDSRFEPELAALLKLLPTLPGELILVSNEVGMGVVPMGETTRRFVDESGRLHQRLAQLCDRVTLVVAGLPMHLKGA